MFDFSMSPDWFKEELELRLNNIGEREMLLYEPDTEILPGDIYIEKMDLRLIQIWVLFQMESDGIMDGYEDTTFIDALEEFVVLQIRDHIDIEPRSDHEVFIRSGYIMVLAPEEDMSPYNAQKTLVRDFKLQRNTRSN